MGDDGGEGVCAAGVWVREAEGWLVGVVKSGGTGQVVAGGWRQGGQENGDGVASGSGRLATGRGRKTVTGWQVVAGGWRQGEAGKR